MLLILARLVYLSGFGSVLHTHATYSQVAFNLFVQTLCSSIWISLLAARNNQAFKYTFINRVSLSTQAGAIVCAPNNNHLHFTMYNNTLHSITILLNYEYKFYKWIEWSRKRRRARDRERERERRKITISIPHTKYVSCLVDKRKKSHARATHANKSELSHFALDRLRRDRVRRLPKTISTPFSPIYLWRLLLFTLAPNLTAENPLNTICCLLSLSYQWLMDVHFRWSHVTRATLGGVARDDN